MPSPEYTETVETLKGLLKQINRMEGDFKESIIFVVLDLRKEILHNSPVLTGWYRANNRVHFGAGVPDDTVGDQKTMTPSNLAAILGGVPAIPTGPLNLVTLFNNVPYAQAVEDGHSQKAPHGVYRFSATRIELQIQYQMDKKGYG